MKTSISVFSIAMSGTLLLVSCGGGGGGGGTPGQTGPTISVQPLSQRVTPPATATFTVTAAGNPTPTYQWNLGGTAIPGANAVSYTTPATTLAMNGGSYTVTVSNSAGTITSSAAILSLDQSAGEEVLFSANDFADLSTLSNPLYAKYEWTIGDDTTPPVEGRAMTHVFTNPGTYQVSLQVTQGVLTNTGTSSQEWDDVYAFSAGTTKTFTKNVIVGGTPLPLPPLVSAAPILELPFEDSIADVSVNNRVVAWGNGTGSFVHGIKGRALDVSGGNYIKVINPSTWLGGASEFTISFWAKKKDTTKATNALISLSGASGQIINYDMYNNASAPTDCRYRFQMITSSGPNSTAMYTRDGYENTLWHHYAFTYSSTEATSRLYLDGRQVATSTPGGTLNPPNSDLLIGYSAGSGAFNGYIDELKIYNKALTARDLSVGFEVWHADIHARSAQYIYVQIPEQVTSNATNRMRVTISGGALGGSVSELANKAGLQSEEKVLLTNSNLNGSQSDYILTTQLQDSTGTELYTLAERFSKTYDGAPRVAIDENNALRINNLLFFPTTPWGLNNDDIAPWVDKGYINTLFGQGFWGSGPNAPLYTINGYRDYLNLGAAKNALTIGPSTTWDGQGHQTQYFFQKSSDPDKIKAYVQALGGNTGQFMWGWWDEPELNKIPAQVLRSWTYISHQYDGQHPVVVNFMGHPYTYVNGVTSWWGSERHTYTYGYSQGVFGMRKPPADAVGFDYYPIDAVRTDATDTLNRLTTALETIRLENFDLLPVMSCVETTDPGNGGDTPWAPSAAQLRMLIWINVVHEAKGIMWFHYFPTTPPANYAEMTRFTRQITALTPVVLGPRVSRTVSIDYGIQTGRIDTMLREYNGKLYLIAVRVSELAYQARAVGTPPPPAQNYSLTNVTFNLGTGIANQAAAVYEETRNVTVTNGQFTDSFEPYAVHVYEIQ